MMDFLPGNKLRQFNRLQGFRNDLNSFEGSIKRKGALKDKDAKKLAEETQLTEGAAKDAIKASVDDAEAKFMAVDEIAIYIKEGSDKGDDAKAKDLYDALKTGKEKEEATSLIAGRGTRFARAGRKLMSLLTKTGLKTLIFGNPITGAMAFVNSMMNAVQKDQLKKEGKDTDAAGKSFIEKLEEGVDDHIVGDKNILGLRSQKDDDVNTAREGLAGHLSANKGKVDKLLKADQAKAIGTNIGVITAIDDKLKALEKPAIEHVKTTEAAKDALADQSGEEFEAKKKEWEDAEAKLKDIQDNMPEKRMLVAQAIAGQGELKDLLVANLTGEDSNLEKFLALKPEQMKQVITAFNLAHFDGTNAARREVTDIQAKFDAVTNATSDDLADKLWAHEKAGPIRAVNMAARKGKEAVMGVAHALWKMEPKTKAIAFSVLAGITTAAAHFNPEMPKENDSSKG